MLLPPSLRTLLLIGLSSTLVLGAPIPTDDPKLAERQSSSATASTSSGNGQSKEVIATSHNGFNSVTASDGTSTVHDEGSGTVGVCLDPNDCAHAISDVDW